MIRNEEQANIEAARGNYEKAEELYLANADMEKKLMQAYEGRPEYAEIRGSCLRGMAGWYSRAANNAIAAGNYDRAKEHCTASLEAFEDLGGKLRLMGSTDVQGEISLSFSVL